MVSTSQYVQEAASSKNHAHKIKPCSADRWMVSHGKKGKKVFDTGGNYAFALR